MTLPGVDVVVVSYNGDSWLDRCLRALLDEAPAAAPTRVVVVDNGSDEATQQVLDSWATRVTVDRAGTNLGFGRAVNRGVALGTNPVVVLVNPDAVVRPGCLDALVRTVQEHPRAGIVGGRTLRPDGTLDPSSCWGRPTLWSWFCAASGLTALFRRSPVFDPESLGRWQRDTPREVDIVTGCLLAVPRAVWDELDGFDERFFMYGEDADLSLRARERGYAPRITPDAVAVHANGASSPRRAHKLRLLMTGKASLARLRWSPLRARTGLVLLASGVAVRAAAERVRGRREPWGALAADWSWLRGWRTEEDR